MKPRRSFSRAIACALAATLASGLVAPASAPTFRHPKLGYTVWYPDGWKVHSPPELIEPLAPPTPAILGDWRFTVGVSVKKRSSSEVDGLFVASSSGAAGYVNDGKVLPEDHTEVAVWREGVRTPCS
ncbi:MAG: hypothetical protein N3C12_00890 [Candidatus Binatia bacterium]|nr:hypothetical protein [Candidatus Binatia bacterium]